MAKIDIYSKSWTELVFENHNKSYGAYYLRKIYADHVVRSSIIAIISFSLAVAGPVIYDWIAGIAGDLNKSKITDVTTLEAPPPIDKNEPPPPPPPAEPPPPLKSTVKFVAPEVVKDEEVQDEPPPTVEELKEVEVGTKTEEGDPDGVDASLVDDGKVIDEAPQIFTIVEQMPEFPGGEAAMLKYIAEKTNYPAMERENGIQGTVFLTFVVRPDGKIDDVKILRGVSGGPNLANEAVRVIKSMPKWKAGKQNGREVNVQFQLPVRFTLK